MCYIILTQSKKGVEKAFDKAQRPFIIIIKKKTSPENEHTENLPQHNEDQI